MISHRYKDYANRPGVHILNVLISLLLGPALMVAALWWWRMVPSVVGDVPLLSGAAKVELGVLTAIIGGIWWISRKLKWINIPFGLDDPRRALVYPYAIYMLRFMMLGMTLLIWRQLLLSGMPQLVPYGGVTFWVAFAVILLGLPPYIYRIATLFRRKELSAPDVADAA